MRQVATPYSPEFFTGHVDGSLRSARIIAPLVCNIAPITSVLDVGCGIGAWLRAFQECGAARTAGIDGEYVNRDDLLIDESCFFPNDLASLKVLPTGFDLTVCVEVLEHLPDEAGRRLVALMTKSAPLVLFSAAIPGQRGTHHINERWHEYWHSEFAVNGFAKLDIIRPQVFSDTDVEVWYRQNVFVYASEAECRRVLCLQQLREQCGPDLVPIQPHILQELTSLRGLVRQVGRQLKQRVFG